MSNRIEQDREDLLGEATALVERIELSVPGFPEPIVAGFRKSRAASIYFGQDPVCHFTSAGELRRAYADGLLYKAEHGRLVALNRQRTGIAVELRRRDLTDLEQAEFLARLTELIGQFRAQLHAGQVSIRGQIPANINLLASVAGWLDNLALPPKVAAAPNAR